MPTASRRATYEGVDAVLDGALRMLAEQPASPAPVERPVPALTPKLRRRGPVVERDGNVFVLRAPLAERIVRRGRLGRLAGAGAAVAGVPAQGHSASAGEGWRKVRVGGENRRV